MLLGQADVLERARKSQTMYQPEQERHQRRPTPRQGLAIVQGFGRDQHDGQGNAGLHRRRTQDQPAQGAGRQRQAVSQRKRGDGADQATAKAHQKQQADHEQQVVDAGQDVLHAQPAIGARHFGAATAVARATEQQHPRLAARHGVDAAFTAAPMDAHDHRRIGLADALHRQVTHESLGTVHDLARADAAFGPQRRQVLGHRLVLARHAPGPDKFAGTGFAQRQVGHAHLMRRGVRRQPGQSHQPEPKQTSSDPQDAADHLTAP